MISFMKAAEEGSFSKAAEALFISAPAVIKQINLLEARLNLRLFERTHRGLQLTKAGESLYRDAAYLVQYSKDAVERARKAMQETQQLIRIGISVMTPTNFLLNLWPKLQEVSPDLQFQLVSFENTPENAREILTHLGANIDVVAGVFDESMFHLQGKCEGMELRREPLCMAVPLSHPLVAKERLTLSELEDETINIIQPGWSKVMDDLRKDLVMNHPDIHLKEFPFYNIDMFNRCVNEGSLLIGVPEWKDIHPLMRMIPVEWDYAIPFGILHAPQPSAAVSRFLYAVRKVLSKG
nr:LysR family transcriptional regulator [Mitsuokella multacida]